MVTVGVANGLGFARIAAPRLALQDENQLSYATGKSKTDLDQEQMPEDKRSWHAHCRLSS